MIRKTRPIHKPSCCVRCHFDYEEDHVFPYLPQRVATHLKQEHDALRAAGYPYRATIEHAKREEGVFARHLPPAIHKIVMIDHERHEAGTLPTGDKSK